MGIYVNASMAFTTMEILADNARLRIVNNVLDIVIVKNVNMGLYYILKINGRILA